MLSKWHESVIVFADMTLDLIFVHHTCSWKDITNQKTHLCSCFCQTEQIDNSSWKYLSFPEK